MRLLILASHMKKEFANFAQVYGRIFGPFPATLLEPAGRPLCLF